MWNSNPGTTNSQKEDDSWEVKAFVEDTTNVMGTTWPPRSYNCMFCKREFRSAQALGGHMNVHRHDRARLHQAQPNLKDPNNISSSTSSAALLIPTQELMVNGGLCLLYSLPKPNNGTFNNLSVLNNVPVSPYSSIDKLMNFQAAMTNPRSFNSFVSNSSNTDEASTSTKCKSDEKISIDHKKRKKTESTVVEGIDLELRLGYS